MDRPYQLLITGPDLHLSTQLPQEKFELLMDLVVNSRATKQSETSVSNSTKLPESITLESTNQPVVQKPDLSQYFIQVNAQRTPDKITAYATLLRQKYDKDTFSRSDLVSAFERAQEPLPKNLSRDISWAEKIGWIAPSGQVDGEYYLTKAGAEAVQSKFPKELKKKTSIHRIK